MELKAVLFDVDGTIAESEELHRNAFNESFKEYGLSWYWDEAIYRELTLVGGGRERIKHYIERTSPEVLSYKNLTSYIDSLHKVKSQIYKDNLCETGISLRPGVKRLINELNKNKIRMSLVSSTTKENLDNLFRIGLNVDPNDWFEIIGHGDCTKYKKPSPEIYHWVLEKMKLPSKGCIAIEDAPRGVDSAVNAGLKVIITPSQYTNTEIFEKGNLVLSDLGEPEKPFTLLKGEAFSKNFVDLELIKMIHKNS